MRVAVQKQTAIMKVIASDVKQNTVDNLKTAPFIIGTDGSTFGSDTFYPIVVRYIDSSNIMHTQLLANPVWNESHTGEAIFDILKKELSSNDIEWENCLALVCDNTNSMTGRHKGVIKFVRDQHPAVHLAGCVCHLLHLASKKATKAFQGEFDFDNVLRMINWYFGKSSKRANKFLLCQKSCEVVEHQLIKHVPTRWLSLGLALNRLLEQWAPVQKFFEEESATDDDELDDGDSVVSSGTLKSNVKKFLRRRTAKLYACFLVKVLEDFELTNKELQTEHAKVHQVKRILGRLYKKLLLCFVKPSATSHGATMTVDFTSKYNIKDKKDLVIGSKAAARIKEGVTKEAEDQFYKDAVVFYQTACTYIKKNINPDSQPLWKHAEVADIALRKTVTFASLVYFLDRFPVIGAGMARDHLQMEFLDFQALTDSDLPEHLFILPQNGPGPKERPVEEQWLKIGEMKDINCAPRFKVLPRVIAGILLVPVANAPCERMFSTVRKNKTDFRGSMNPALLKP